MGAVLKPETPQEILARLREKANPQLALARLRSTETITAGGDEPVEGRDITVGGVEPVEDRRQPALGIPTAVHQGTLAPPKVTPIEEAGPVRRGAASGAAFIEQAAGAFASGFGRETRRGTERAREALPGSAIQPRDTGGPGKVSEFLERKGTEMVEQGRAREEVIPGPKSLSEIVQNPNLGDALDWAAFSVSSGVVSSIPSLVGGATGFAAAGPAGAWLGAAAPGYILNQHEVRRALLDEGVSEDDAEQLSAFAAVPMAALDALLPSRLGSKLAGPIRDRAMKAIVKAVMAEAARGAPMEGITETLQSFIEQGTTAAVTGKPIDVAQALEEGLAGLLTGGVLSGVTAAAGGTATEVPGSTVEDVSGTPAPGDEARRRLAAIRDEEMQKPTFERRGVPKPPELTIEQRAEALPKRAPVEVTPEEALANIRRAREEEAEVGVGQVGNDAYSEPFDVRGGVDPWNETNENQLESVRKMSSTDLLSKPIIVVEDIGNGSIMLDGHHRLAIAKERELGEIPAWVVPSEVFERIVADEFDGDLPPRSRDILEYINFDGRSIDEVAPDTPQDNLARQQGTQLRHTAAVPSPFERPTKVQRYEEAGVPIGDTSKPQGLYTNPVGMESPHEDLGGERHELDVSPEANVLEVDATDLVRTNRGTVGQSAGIAALRNLLGNEETSALLGMHRETLQLELERRWPDVEWGKYYDEQEMLEGHAGLLAREKGYDAIWAPDRTAPEHNEYVGLTPEAFAPATELRHTVGVPSPFKGKKKQRVTPPRPGQPAAESKPATRRRLTLARDMIEELAIQIEPGNRVQLGDEFKAEIGKIMKATQLPARLKGIFDVSGKMTTHKRAKDLIEKTLNKVEDELHRTAVDNLQKAYTKALTVGLRPPFLADVKVAVEDIGFAEMNQKTRAAMFATARYLAQNPDNPIPKSVLRNIRKLDKAKLKEMSADDIFVVLDAVETAIHMSRIENRVLAEERKETLDQLRAKVSADAERLPELKRKGGTRSLIDRIMKRDLEGMPVRGAVGIYLKEWASRPEILMEHLGETLRHLGWEQVTVQGQNKELQFVNDQKAALFEAYRKEGLTLGPRVKPYQGGKQGILEYRKQSKKFEKWRKKSFRIPARKRGKKGQFAAIRRLVQISRGEAMSFLGAIRDPYILELFYREGITLDRSGQSFLVDDQFVADVKNAMGAKEKNLVDYVVGEFNGPLPGFMNPAWVKVYGKEVATRDNYWPASIDRTRAQTSKDPIEQMALEKQSSLEGWGHLKGRTGAAAPMRIGDILDTYLNHLSWAARIGAYLAPARDFLSVMGDPDVKESILSRVGKFGYNRIVDSVKKQTTPPIETSAPGRVLRKFLRSFGGSVLGLRIMTLFVNPSGLSISASYQKNGGVHLLKSLKEPFTPKTANRIIRLAQKHSPYWTARYSNFIFETTSGLVLERSRSYGPPGVTELGLEPLQRSDMFGAIIRWKMAELHINETTKLKQGTQEYYHEVALEWERLMYRGENTGHGGDMTGAIAFGKDHVWFAPFVTFTSSVSKIFTAGVRGQLQVARGQMESARGDKKAASASRKAAATSLAAVLVAQFYVSVARETRRSLLGDDDDEPMVTRVPKRMVKDYLGFIPIFGKLLGPLWNKAMGGSGYVYPMSAAEGELLNWGQTAVELIDGTQKLIEGELDSSGENAGWKKLEKGFEGTFEAIAHMRGIPYGWQDIPRIVKRLFPNDPDFEALMRDEGKSVPITQENLRILRAIAEDNDEEFRKYVERLSAKRERPTESDVVAIVNREFGKFTKYEPGEDARKAKEAELAAIPLTPRKRFQGLRWRLGLDGLSQDREQRSEFLEYVDLKLAERAELREAAEDMVMRNRDIIRSTPRKR